MLDNHRHIYTRFVLALLLLGLVFFGRDTLFRLPVGAPESPGSPLETLVNAIKKEVSAPPPLRAPNESPGAQLTRSGTIEWTNTERKNNGLLALRENDSLDEIARLRLQDMFARQYFAHVAPDGTDVTTVTKQVGYDYLAIGENLALGNFADDKDLVEAWMNSPGHRANILNEKYEEIGVAVKQGIFENRSTWLAVQVFGMPSSACPAPDEATAATIEQNKIQIASLEAELNAQRAELQSGNRRRPDYNAQVTAYNALVNQYNSFIAATQNLVTEYNNEVHAFNLCVGTSTAAE